MSGYITGLNDQFHPRFRKDIIDLIEQTIDERKSQEVEKIEEIPTKQQILILHYLGVISDINLEDTKKALLLSKLLNRHKQNIRKCLIEVNVKIDYSDIKTPNNLETVRKIFEEVGLTDEVELVNRDIEKLNITK